MAGLLGLTLNCHLAGGLGGGAGTGLGIPPF